jgi:CheY-like chemotaxis protein
MENDKKQIMVVDDEPQITKLLRLILLENFDCEVETYNDPREAFKRMQEKNFDAITLDHRMPKFTGMEIVKALRCTDGLNQNTRIMLISGFREEAESLHFDLLEEVIFLEKPVEEIKFVRWMKVLLVNKKNPT